jgi:hypothetical protein
VNQVSVWELNPVIGHSPLVRDFIGPWARVGW